MLNDQMAVRVKASCDLLLPVASNNRQGRAVGGRRGGSLPTSPGDQTTTCLSSAQASPAVETLQTLQQHHKCFSSYKLLFVLLLRYS